MSCYAGRVTIASSHHTVPGILHAERAIYLAGDTEADGDTWVRSAAIRPRVGPAFLRPRELTLAREQLVL